MYVQRILTMLLVTLAVLVPQPSVTSAAVEESSSIRAPLIESTSDEVAFSPNGDRRLDTARVGFSLERSARAWAIVRSHRQLVYGPVRLGSLAAGRHTWQWDGRGNGGRRVPDGEYSIVLQAKRQGLAAKDRLTAVVDTSRPKGRLASTRTTIFPRAVQVADRVQLIFLEAAWRGVFDETFDSEGIRVRFRIRDESGRVVAQHTSPTYTTPKFVWSGHRRDGGVVRAGEYVARVLVTDLAGNRRTYRQQLTVSPAQLVEQTWAQTMAAAQTSTYEPFFGGCNGCYDYCDPVASDRFASGLSFRPCVLPWQYGTVGFFRSDVPFEAAPVDSYRVTASGGPTTTGSADQGRVQGIPTAPGDASTSTPWLKVKLDDHPYLKHGSPMAWSFDTDRANSYDVATFTVEYRHYVPAP